MPDKINNILSANEHRFNVLPSQNWQFFQSWKNVSFLHWKIDYDILRGLVPNQFTLDSFDNQFWVSLVIFELLDVRHRFLNIPPFLSNFKQINIRTYVKWDNQTGVYFLDISTNSILLSLVANFITGLNYQKRYLKFSGNVIHSQNLDESTHLRLDYSIGNNILVKSQLDNFLTEKYSFFNLKKHSTFKFDIHHLEWDLSSLKINQFELNHSKFSDFIIHPPDKAHFSNGLDVISWKKKILKS